jgi:hypothetical protein
MRNALLIAVCPFLSGCIAFAYPSVRQTPEIVVPEPDVRAFRYTSDFGFFGAIIAGAVQVGDKVEEVPITNATIDAHRDNYCRYCFMAYPIFATHHTRNETIRLYRRGYEVAEIESRHWLLESFRTQPIAVTWRKAETLEAQEKAIDDLTPGFGGWTPSFAVFLAEEYSHLSESPLADAQAQKRLRAKESDPSRARLHR